jgi:hypothetical protein
MKLDLWPEHNQKGAAESFTALSGFLTAFNDDLLQEIWNLIIQYFQRL